jgi:TatD DNase family protein
MMSPFINFHTHQSIVSNHLYIYNYYFENLIEPSVKYLSAGIHPWYIKEKNFVEQLQFIEGLLQQEKLTIVGECGFDTKKNKNLALQETIFINHVSLSEAYKKPLIIHCVNQHDLLITIMKKINPKMTWIIHGFSQSKKIAEKCLEQKIKLSFGLDILKKKELQNLIMELNFDQFFLETDDSNSNVEILYRYVAQLKNCDLSIVKNELFKNFHQDILI